ncbi:hypothetical protein [Streptomyces sp. CB01580]|uniref:hypothetical protein n=1 Tax=Streptomyces sp. CB01580 TaxID=1703933 RepID=UPI00093D3708|nr:hypothetical protein [Streptomyces sp. CB01580]OKJ43848.1 hypothetical protein AMK22_04450 [Streptomyces sp. CB01580]
MPVSGETRFEAELKRLGGDLQRLRLSCGEPTYDQVCDRAREHGQAVGKSTISELFGGKRLPGLDVYMVIVRALLAYPLQQAEERQDGQPQQKAAEPPGRSRRSPRIVAREDDRLKPWRDRWQNLRALQKGLTSPPEPTGTDDPDLKPVDRELPSREPEGQTAPLAPDAVAETLGQQLVCLLSDDEQVLLEALSSSVSGTHSSRIDLCRLAEIADVSLPAASAGHVVSVLRSLMARDFLRKGADGNYMVSDAGRRALTRRRMQ